MRTHYVELTHETERHFQVIDITEDIRQAVAASGIAEGMAIVGSLHTTVALTVNENESRLLRDMEDFFLSLAPPQAAYLHDDIHLRDCPPEEPQNAHAHLIAMMLGNALTLVVHAGAPVLGAWQSVLMVEVDGPRTRRLALQVMGA